MASKLAIFQHPPNDFKPSVIVAACYCQWEEKVLVLKRNPHKVLGYSWGVPAGKIEDGESPSQAVVREVYEEIGIQINEVNLKNLSKLYVRRSNADVVLYRFLIIFPTQPALSLNLEEHSHAQWVTIPEALALPNITGAVMGLKFL